LGQRQRPGHKRGGKQSNPKAPEERGTLKDAEKRDRKHPRNGKQKTLNPWSQERANNLPSAEREKGKKKAPDEKVLKREKKKGHAGMRLLSESWHTNESGN